MKHWFEKIKNAGIEEQFSDRKKRAIRTSNLLTLNGINICALFTIAFLRNNELRMAASVGICSLLYLSGYLITAAHWPNLGRSVTLISGCLCITDIALYYRGDAHTQFLLLCMVSVPLVMIEWESLWLIICLQALPVSLVLFCQMVDYSFYTVTARPQNLETIQKLSLFIGFSQTLFGMYLFARESVYFENQNLLHIKALDLEHSKQMQAQKMSALGEMSAGMAHELNNPLAIISAKCFQLQRSLGHDPLDKHSLSTGLQKISETSERIAKIIRALRAFSRNAENDPMEDKELITIVSDALSLSEERMKRAGIKIEVDIDPSLRISCRPTQVSQVLINLLNNAYDAVKDVSGERPWVKITAKKKGPVTEMYVMDNGTGIDPQIREKIMQPFFTTKEPGKGTGLGLSISKGLMESMKGDLRYVPGNQTLFCVSFKTSVS